MSIVTIELAPDTERKLRDQASQTGQTLEGYLRRLAENAVSNRASGELEKYPRYTSDPHPTRAEFERGLNALSTGPKLPILPTDFSRADIYDDHD